MHTNGRVKPVTGEIYHVYNRGVEGREIFLSNAERYRFIHDLYEFNDENAAPFLTRWCRDTAADNINRPERKRDLLVEILAFCIMPNHFHLLLRQKVDDGVSKFMQKLGTGYTCYFNNKFKRKGVLFQGKYKAKHLSRESHFFYIPHYIHLNPLDLMGCKWREGKVGNAKEAFNFLISYKWSSFSDYIGRRNFPSVTYRNFILDIFGGPERYAKALQDCISTKNFNNLTDVAIDD